jgi:hypothetical protein
VTAAAAGYRAGMTDTTPTAGRDDEHEDGGDDAAGQDAEDVANCELPLNPAGPTELGDAVDG